MNAETTRWLRASLVLVWLGTALASAIESQGQGRDLLVRGGLQSEAWIQALVWDGIAADTAIGLALWLRPGRATDALALALMGVMTVVATVLLPALWLDPLGPLLKNLPIAAILVVLLKAPRT
ncbi:DoxX-like family protein [Acidovorax sp. SUPP2522]|uniref:DoxX-like family protein n=1 Tax=unclassified Acidovorax TaxID=2684926 RepID=UPI00234B7BA4|nr:MULTISPECIES: DoxX-like family protein [unclassified Acidovorax]WCM96343.1 DoxX-like family protein [Acidovorax sp. GBBC 1281]GKT18380.1 DoxX-like family protein [Acidovorax sp. SUPP2522]